MTHRSPGRKWRREYVEEGQLDFDRRVGRWVVTRDCDSAAAMRLFCFPHAGAGASAYRDWEKELAADLHVCRVQLPGREERSGEPAFTHVSEIAEVLAKELQPWFDRPFVFFGHSMGALIAFELTRKLRSVGAALPQHLFVTGRAAPHLPSRTRSIHHLCEAEFKCELRLLNGTAELADMLTTEERFVSACARGDETEARRLLEPGIFARLSPAQLKQLPGLAMSGRDDAVRLMVELGWPIATRGGDIDGSALNWAVFRGRPELAEFLLEHGASFRESHGYGSDVLGTLCWASINQPRADGDWEGCAAALLGHGLPPVTAATVDTTQPGMRTLHIDGRDFTFPAEIADVLLG